MKKEEANRIKQEKIEHLEYTVRKYEFFFTVPIEHNNILIQIGTEEEIRCSFPGCRILNRVPLDA